MTKSIILSILLVLVYQFDELVRMLAVILKRNKHLTLKNTDQLVGTALTIALMPLIINFIFMSAWPLATKLGILFMTYIGFAIAAAGVSKLVYEMEQVQKYGGVMTLIGMSQVVGGMFHPVLHQVPWRAGRERLTFAKLALLLSLPPAIGLAFSLFYDTYYYDTPQFDEYVEVLIIVMVGGLFINICIHALEKYFARANLGVMGYYRIVLGLGVAFYMIL